MQMHGLVMEAMYSLANVHAATWYWAGKLTQVHTSY